MAKKLSVLKPLTLKNLNFFLSFSDYNSEDTATNFEKDMFRKESLTKYLTIFAMSRGRINSNG